jgi:hypothetical protein
MNAEARTPNNKAAHPKSRTLGARLAPLDPRNAPVLRAEALLLSLDCGRHVEPSTSNKMKFSFVKTILVVHLS